MDYSIIISMKLYDWDSLSFECTFYLLIIGIALSVLFIYSSFIWDYDPKIIVGINADWPLKTKKKLFYALFLSF